MNLCTYTVRGFVICVLCIYEVVAFLDIVEQFPWVELRFRGPEIPFTPKPCPATDVLELCDHTAVS